LTGWLIAAEATERFAAQAAASWQEIFRSAQF